MNTKLLRQKVLDLAIHGKLLDKAVVEALETTPGYEPASKLLERIRGESLPLATAGKPSSAAPSPRGKAPKTPSTPITEDEIPFEIPENWCWCRLGDIFNLQAGKSISASELKDKSDSLYPCYGGNGIRGYVDYFSHYGEYPIIGRQGALCGNLNYANNKFYATEHAVVVSVMDSINPRWAYYFLKQLNLNQYASSMAQPGLAVSTIVQVLIPLPPLEEQKLIVEEIERIFALIDTVEQNKTDLETVIKQTKSKILDLAIHGKLVPQDKTDEPASVLFEKIKKEKQLTDVDEIEELPFEIPSSWKWVHLSDVCLKLKRGKSPKYVEKSNYMAFAQKCNQKDGPTSLEKALYIDESSLNRYPPEEYMKKYDTVINSTGTGTLGRVGIYDCDVPEGIKGVFADSHVTTIHPSSYVNPKYVYYFVKSKQRYLESAGEGSTNQKELKVTTIGEMEFPLPPIEEQNRIVLKIENVLQLINAI